MKCAAVGCGRKAPDGRTFCQASCQDQMDRRLGRARELARTWDRPDALLDALKVPEACRRVLVVLRHAPATTLELTQAGVGGLGAVQRMYDLRQLGWSIESEHINRKNHLYTLTGEPGQAAPRVEEAPGSPDAGDPSLADQETGPASAPPRLAPAPEPERKTRFGPYDDYEDAA